MVSDMTLTRLIRPLKNGAEADRTDVTRDYLPNGRRIISIPVRRRSFPPMNLSGLSKVDPQAWHGILLSLEYVIFQLLPDAKQDRRGQVIGRSLYSIYWKLH